MMENKSKDLFIGIDPGKSGAIVILTIEGDVLLKQETPSIGKEYDKHAMHRVLQTYKHRVKHVVLEDVHAIQGKVGGTSNFEFGRGKGLWEMALCALDIPHTLIQPKEWQRVTWQGVPKQTLPTKRILKDGSAASKVDTKATSLIASKRLFPKEDLRKNERSKVPHDGIVDALLIAEACRRQFK